MKDIKLQIETHKKSNNSNSFFVNKKNFVKDSSNLHKILKEKLKDRYRVKGACFSRGKTIDDNIFKKKKEKSLDLLDIEEAYYLISMNNYDKLKYFIHSKEKKEKEERKIKEIKKNEMYKKDINYTTLRETIYQFLRFKKNSNLYRANILKNKIELKLANKISKKNFINRTFKNVMMHFHSVKGKVDLGKKPEEETENEYAYKKLVEQIAKSRLKYLQKLRNESDPMSPSKSKSLFRKSIMILNRRNSATKEKNLIDILSSNITENNENNNKNKIIEKEFIRYK